MKNFITGKKTMKVIILNVIVGLALTSQVAFAGDDRPLWMQDAFSNVTSGKTVKATTHATEVTAAEDSRPLWMQDAFSKETPNKTVKATTNATEVASVEDNRPLWMQEVF